MAYNSCLGAPGAAGRPKRVLLGLSGGVDSAVSAHLLKEAGLEVAGACMVVWPEGPAPAREGPGARKAARSCFAPDSGERRARVEALARKLDIALVFVDCRRAFEEEVLGDFRREYLAGRTPNPCVLCNPRIKFGAMAEGARRMGVEFDHIATGHYARIERDGGRFCLGRAADLGKDQSYFLYRLGQETLSRTIFPLGGLTKAAVRAIARGLGLEEAQESSDFYPGAYSDLLGVAPREGRIVDEEGRVLGTHKGFWNYTIGQRRGLGVAAAGPLHVIGLRPSSNEVVVGPEEKAMRSVVRARDIVWGSCGSPGDLDGRAWAKVRSVGAPLPCEVWFEDGRLAARFDSKVLSPAPGQSLVVYDAEGRIVCGGFIDGWPEAGQSSP